MLRSSDQVNLRLLVIILLVA